MTARPLAVFDIDGVLADVRHRLRFVERRPKDWDAFFAAAVDDPPLEQGVALARASAEDCEVVYVTGRPERCRADTLAGSPGTGCRGPAVDALRARPAAGAAGQAGAAAPARAGRPVAVVVDVDAQVCAPTRRRLPSPAAEWMAGDPP
jgi:hypothetical protein